MIEKPRMIDTVEIIVKDKDGTIKAKHIIGKSLWHRLLCKLGLRHNSITKWGMAIMASLCNGAGSEVVFTYINIGTGTNAASVNDEDLQTPLLSTRVSATVSRVTTTYTNDTAQWVYTFSKANNPTLSGTSVVTETGIFNASTGVQKILLRQVWSGDVLNWDAGDSIQMTVKCQMKQGS